MDTFRNGSNGRTVGDRPVPCQTCTTVDLIGQTNVSGKNSLHYAARDSKKDVQILQFLIDNYNGDIEDIINDRMRKNAKHH